MDLLESKTYCASIEAVSSDIGLEQLRNKTVLIAGASGMLGSCLVDMLGLWDQSQPAPCRIVAVSRDREQAEERFHSFWKKDWFVFQAQDVCAPMKDLPGKVDYIIHAASNADPIRMASAPAETLLSNVIGTQNLFDHGISHGMERFLFVSSGEVYGQPDEAQDDFREGYCGPLDLSSLRSCYPEGKRAAEVLCQSYISQYGTDAVIVRPCHLFGPTMRRGDSRAASEFLRSAADGWDIVMKSDGQLERSHCCVMDAAGAVLTVLLNGKRGEAYNIADRRYQMRIRDFARRAAEAGGCWMRYEAPSNLEQAGYSRTSRAVLDPSRLEALGWRPRTNEAIKETVDILREIKRDTPGR